VDTGRDWGTAGKQGEEADKAKPVANRPTTKNAFSQ
jgi:hypothetical protein